MKKEYWYCVIGPANPDKYKGNGADWPLRRSIEMAYSEFIKKKFTCASGWGVTTDQERQISFATRDDDLKRATIQSYHDEGKPLPRHMRAWELLFQEESK
jgi:hypothetical protein